MSVSLPSVKFTGSGALRDLATLAALALCFLLSGFAALIYQIAWARQFAVVFGTSEPAVATVLAAYMGGLALGARLVERWLPRLDRPVLIYAVLELGIGASALLLVPALLTASDWALHMTVGGQADLPDSEQVATTLFHLASSFVAVAVPTTLMGATLPLLTRHAVRTEAQIGRRVGLLYAINTTGAILGALGAAFWLLPRVGLTQTIRAAAAVNLVVFLAAVVLVRVAPGGRPGLWPARFPAERPPAPFWVLPLMFVSGAVSFFYEVLWTRMLSHVLGSSIHAFGVMVASFLGGIALGGAIGALLARDRRWAATALVLSQVGCALSAAVAYGMMAELLPEKAGLVGNALLGATLMLPLTICIGTTFPLAVRVLADDADEAPGASARVYYWNTLGAIVGALAAGFILIPALRFEGAIQLGVIVNLALAVATLWLIQRPHRAFATAVVTSVAATAFFFRPLLPEALLRASPLNLAGDGRMLYYDVGRSASVVVLEQDGGLALRTNGLPEALMDLRGSPPRFSGEYWLSPLAVVARPQTRSMLVVGYGGGVVIEGIPPSVEQVDVVEIEPKVIEANRAISTLRKRDPLADPRVNIVSNDARGALHLTARRYDAIVSQPSHPWTAGASHLYTREFIQQARAHLTEGGVFVQWMNIGFLDEALLRSLTATVLEVFGEVRIYRPDPSTLLLLGSTRSLDIEKSLAATGLPLKTWPEHYGGVGINTVEDLVGALAVDAEGARRLARDAPLITDDHNIIATASVYEHGRGLTAEAVGALLAPYDPLQHSDSWVFEELGDRLAFHAIARRLSNFVSLDSSVPDRLHAMADALRPSAAGAAVRAIAMIAHGGRAAANEYLADALLRFPEDETLRYLYVEPWLGQLARDLAPPEIAAEAAKLSEPAAAVVRAGRFSVRSQWSEVAALDDVLAQTHWTDAWKFQAVQIRADWRTRMLDAGSRHRLGDEALAIVDRAIVVYPTLVMYGLRARSALAAGRPNVLLESIWSFGQGTFTSNLRLPPEERSEGTATLKALIRLLDTEVTDGQADERRIQEVRARLEHAVRRLGEA